MSYAEYRPHHCRLSCSDTDRCNVAHCERCTALELDDLVTLRTEFATQSAEIARLRETLEKVIQRAIGPSYRCAAAIVEICNEALQEPRT